LVGEAADDMGGGRNHVGDVGHWVGHRIRRWVGLGKVQRGQSAHQSSA
jgi:hypothetical protein